MLEQQQAQLVAGLQELYRRTQNGQGWEGAPLKESSHGTPLTHDILERLGALKSGRHKLEVEHFEEDLTSLQQGLLANGAGFMQRASSDSDSESGHSPTVDHVPRQVLFKDPFSFGKLPPTPPTHSPFPQTSSPALQLDSHSKSQRLWLPKGVDDSSLQRETWASSDMALDNNMGLLDQYDSPVSLDTAPNPFDALQMPLGTIAPYLSMRDWNHDVDFQRYFTTATM